VTSGEIRNFKAQDFASFAPNDERDRRRFTLRVNASHEVVELYPRHGSHGEAKAIPFVFDPSLSRGKSKLSDGGTEAYL
jgi:hypothetical protein